jgi:pyruvate,orthophosphate dikinase
MTERSVYSFGAIRTDGDGSMKALLGGKGCNLAEMTRIGIPVPPGFTITTAECIAFEAAGGELSEELQAEITRALSLVEQEMQYSFGDPKNPLLVSVRSGARSSMPGMMDTVLNVGLNDATVEGVIARTGDARFAYDSYRRFIQMFGDVVLGVDHFYFEEELYKVKASAGVKGDHELSPDQLRELIDAYKGAIRSRTEEPFPEDPREQLMTAIKAVFRSWHNDRARHYREINDIPHDWGTAVNVQAMVFGNMGDTSATGVAFTRSPSTGARERYGEFLANAQGEDVVAGIRTPQPLSRTEDAPPSLEETMPEAYAELVAIEDRLEAHYRDMQDIEFTIQQGRLWILQTRTGKRTAAAAVRIAVDQAEEGLITRDEALMRIKPSAVEELLHPRLDPDAPRDIIARGLAASPGAATGSIVLTAEDAEREAALGKSVVLVRLETTPEDIRGMSAASGILTARGGITSHAAVVARQMGKCCVAGCAEVEPDLRARTVRIGGILFSEGDQITLDGTRGQVIRGTVPTVPGEIDDAFSQLMEWADEKRTIGVWTNADKATDAALARSFGAAGIGLVRTEHMFFEGDRINAMREMIVSDTPDARADALEKLRPFQREDFEGILRAMDGLPVTIRLLDPPLHEFLPERDEDIAEVGAALGRTPEQIRALVSHLHESNPMLGHRGCRLGITRPEIYQMQTRAIFDATLALVAEGLNPQPQIMIPLVSTASELEYLRNMIDCVRNEYEDVDGALHRIKIGTMLELPRACTAAGELAEHADFLSFGTNDLTQTTFGFSRDDAASFLPHYLEKGLLEHDPFVVLDTEGVGYFIKLACRRARRVKPDISIGICGEHGGEPRSVAWIQKGAVSYVSCSPFRVPIARLAAAQAAITG